MMGSGFTVKQVLAVPCPTCGAFVGKSCEFVDGRVRAMPHLDREQAALTTRYMGDADREGGDDTAA